MPTYKDEKTNTYYCTFYYKDWQGNQKRKLKRGFKLARDAKQYEIDFLSQFAKTPSLLFSVLADAFLADSKARIKPSTLLGYKETIKNHILPFFKDYPTNEITPLIVRQWQNTIIEKGLAPKTQNNYSIVLSTLFNFAVKYYDLPKNSCTVCGLLGTSKSQKSQKMQIWTVDNFNTFMQFLNEQKQLKTPKGELIALFNVLFFCGLRVGECLALTVADYKNSSLDINKSLMKLGGKDILSTPKTDKSTRVVSCPQKLCNILDEHITHLPDKDAAQPLFPFSTRRKIQKALDIAAADTNIPRITIHDLRHSHASMLINANVTPLAISERLGHENVQTTLNIYSHLYKTTADKLTDTLNDYML